ncbi:hypothetical protein C4559_03300 [Candidatus Microgenomates bacterium]|nr:MAG: hypothetical protein C4559_03300 [Candidatus Microgenomates bacterium]
MKKIIKNKEMLVFLFFIFFFTFILFRQVFIQNKIPLNSNLLASFFSPWSQEKFSGWEVGIPNKPTAKDDLWIFYPQKTLTISLLKNWEIPFWNPYSFSGNYHLGLSETAVFYPLNFLFLFFSQIDVWVLLIIIEPIIAGLGMYFFLRRIVLNEKSAFVGSMAFAFSGIVIARSVEGLSVGHTLIWMPYVFWGIEAFFQTKKIRFLSIILLSLFLSLLAGWFQYTFYIFTFSLIYSLFKIFFILKEHLKINYLVIIPFIVLPLITLFHTIPAFQALLDSPRSALEGRLFSFNHLMSPFHIFTLIFPDFWGNPAVYNYFGKSDYKESIMFIGVIPLIFSLVSIFKKKKKMELFFLGSIIFSFSLAIDNPISKAIISSSLPVFSSFLPNRIFLVSTFSFCVLASFGFDYVFSAKKDKVIPTLKKTFIFIWLIVIVLVSFLAFRILKDPSVLNKVDAAGINLSKDAIQFKNSIIPVLFLLITTVVFFVFRNKYFRIIFFFLIIIVLFLQSYIFGQKYIPFSNREFIYPVHSVFTFLKEHQGLDRFMSVGSGHIVAGIPLQFGLYSPEGIGSMYIRRYGELVRYMKLGDYGVPDKIAFDLEIYPKDVFYPNNTRLSRFFELTSVKHVVVDKKSLLEQKIVPGKNFNLVWENDRWQIYQYTKSMPRFFASSNFEVISDKKQILKFLFSDSFDPKKIILEEDPGFRPKNYIGNLKVTSYSPNKISMEVVTDNPTLVYFSDNYSKAFKVFINGKEGRIIRANYSFRAIPVPKGNSSVVVSYDNSSILFGFWTATIILLAIIGFLFYFVRIKLLKV